MSKSRISIGVIRRDSFDHALLTELQSRDAALWLGAGVGESSEDTESIADFVALPWQCVLSESSSKRFVEAIEQRKDDPVMVAYRGYLDIVPSNPEDLQLPTRTLAIYLLNGREGADDPQARPNLSPNKSLLRRLTMLKRMTDGQPRTLLAISSGEVGLVDSLVDLWEDGFRANLVFVTPNESEIAALETRICSGFGISGVTVYCRPCGDFAREYSAHVRQITQTSTLIVRIRDESGQIQAIDATSCERHDHPLLDRFELLQERDLSPLLPDDLSDEELNSFFERSSSSWRPYAAGLPWVRSQSPWKDLKRALQHAHEQGSAANRILAMPSPSGAGGTTTLRQLAYHAAVEGYPTLVARSVDFEPEHPELTGFLFNLQQERIKAQDKPQVDTTSGDVIETPAVIAFDAHHWLGREDSLINFFKAFDRAGRSVVFLVVLDRERFEHVASEAMTILDVGLSHELTEVEALQLGQHLNRFLTARGKGRTEAEWRSFHQAHVTPIGDFGATPASFWIALEFWLRRQLQLGESIQEWLYTQFSKADLSDADRSLLLRIAAMSIERVGLPDELLPKMEGPLPISLQLDAAGRKVPSLGLVRSTSASRKQWALGHVQLARYLINLAYRDRDLLQRLGWAHVANIVEFRLELLRSIACNPLIAYARNVPLAIEFAQKIFKLDRDGNREFFSEWRRVLQILEDMPERIWETSRAFNHHIAISRRRIASDSDFFPLTPEEKRAQLNAAAEHLEFSLDRIESQDDDTDLNLLNSLARCYQDLADLELATGGTREAVNKFRDSATECIRRAQQVNPTNSHVLETLARDRLQSAEALAEREPVQSAQDACEALTYLRQALTLESAEARRPKLNGLLTRCFQLLSGEAVGTEITRLRQRGEVVGIVASAWIELRKEVDSSESLALETVSPSQIDAALNILSEVPSGKHSWIDLRLNYDLVAVREPYNFTRQLELLDAIVLETSRTDLQTQLEYAVLLYQVGRFPEGSEIFRQLRRAIRESEVFVVVPDRLRYLWKPGTRDPEVCNAVVVDSHAVRSLAAVENLKKEKIPFIPREFKQTRMGVKQRFQCHITFGPNGPFIRPAQQSGKA